MVLVACGVDKWPLFPVSVIHWWYFPSWVIFGSVLRELVYWDSRKPFVFFVVVLASRTKIIEHTHSEVESINSKILDPCACWCLVMGYVRSKKGPIIGASQRSVKCPWCRWLGALPAGRLTTSMAPPPVHLFKGGKGDSEIPLERGSTALGLNH